MEKQQNRNFGNQLAISWQHCEFRKLLAISSQPLRISQTVRKQFAISVRIAKFAGHMHCAFAKFASHIKLQNLSEISHCQLRNAIANFAIPFPTSQHHCQLRNSLANFATHCQIRYFERFFLLRNLQALSSSVINATDFQTW